MQRSCPNRRGYRSVEPNTTSSTIAATTGGRTIVEAVLSTDLGAGVAVHKLVVVHADVPGLAGKVALFHVADASRADDGHLLTFHVGQLADIHHSHFAEGILSPGIVDLSVEHDGVRVDGGPRTGLTRGEADGDAGVVGDGGGDVRLLDVDP